MQKATLDPTKISGYCGRLKCCLRYEDDLYVELKRNLPRKKTLVNTPQGQGRVVDGLILAQMVIIELGDGKIVTVPLGQIEIVEAAPSDGRADDTADEASGETRRDERKDNFRKDTKPDDSINNQKETDNTEDDRQT